MEGGRHPMHPRHPSSISLHVKRIHFRFMLGKPLSCMYACMHLSLLVWHAHPPSPILYVHVYVP